MGDLAELLSLQHRLQRHMGNNFRVMSVGERIRFIEHMHTATIRELGEALDECTWKSWTVGNPTVHSDRMLDELVDVLHFVLNWALAAAPGATPDTLAAVLIGKYRAKNRRNRERYDSGAYDGVKSKCPACQRALDDVGIDRRAVGDDTFLVTCGACQADLDTQQIIEDTIDPRVARPTSTSGD